MIRTYHNKLGFGILYYYQKWKKPSEEKQDEEKVEPYERKE